MCVCHVCVALCGCVLIPVVGPWRRSVDLITTEPRRPLQDGGNFLPPCALTPSFVAMLEALMMMFTITNRLVHFHLLGYLLSPLFPPACFISRHFSTHRYFHDLSTPPPAMDTIEQVGVLDPAVPSPRRGQVGGVSAAAHGCGRHGRAGRGRVLPVDAGKRYHGPGVCRCWQVR